MLHSINTITPLTGGKKKITINAVRIMHILINKSNPECGCVNINVRGFFRTTATVNVLLHKNQRRRENRIKRTPLTQNPTGNCYFMSCSVLSISMFSPSEICMHVARALLDTPAGTWVYNNVHQLSVITSCDWTQQTHLNGWLPAGVKVDLSSCVYCCPNIHHFWIVQLSLA